ncbi:MAG: hydrolase [Planctomycetes bacterium]|nr:hydrolase [Planctomycetota bacterium]
MKHPTQLLASESAVLVVDVQEKLMPKILGAEALIRNSVFLLDAARLLDVAIHATEQYPKGLGPTVAPLAQRVPHRPEKVGFSCCAIPELTEAFRANGQTRIVLVGIETHVCVLNTALDLLAANFHVYLAIDALGSRYAIDHEIALRRLERAGAILTTVETCVFEWMGGSRHPAFKQISALVQERMKASG